MKKTFFILTCLILLLIFLIPSILEEANEYEQGEIIFTDWLSINLLEDVVFENERHRQWATDINQFRNDVFAGHPRFFSTSVFTDIEQLEQNKEIGFRFNESLATLINQVPELTDFQVKVGLQSSAAMLDDNHFVFGSRTLTDGSFSFWEYLYKYEYPLYFRWLYDGFYLTNAYEKFEKALNHKLVAINGSYDFSEQIISVLGAENIYNARNFTADSLNAANILRAIGKEQPIVYTFVNDGGEFFSISVDTYYTREERASINIIDNRAYGDLPKFYQNSHESMWFTLIEDKGILYIRVRRFPGGTGAWMELRRFIADIDKDDIKATIVDVRNNLGGSPDKFSFYVALKEITPPDMLFNFINEGSFSMSLHSALQLESLGAKVVGMPSGQNINFFSSGILLHTLYYSGYQFELGQEFLNNQLRFRIESEDNIFRPHVHIDYTIDDWINNRDPLFEYVVSSLEG